MTRLLRDHSLGRLVVRPTLVVVAAIAVTACHADDDARPEPTSDLVDGRVCGFFTPEVVESVLGHDAFDTLGEGIGPSDERAQRAQECDVLDRNRDAVVLRVEVTDDPTTPPRDRSTEPSTDCDRPAALEGWSGSVCWREDRNRVTVLAWPDGGARLINLDYFPANGATDPAQRSDHVDTAITLVMDVHSNVEAYDDAHG